MSFWQAVHQGGVSRELHSGLAPGVGGHRGTDATVIHSNHCSAQAVPCAEMVGGERCRKNQEYLI